VPASNARLLTRGNLLLVCVLALGVAVRGASLTLNGAWDGLVEYDDGVHFGAAELLLSGQVPYRDFVFVQPPGVALLLQPAALLGRAVGEDVAWGFARLGFVALGLLNIGLVWALLRRYGTAAAVGGAAFYAVWYGTASTERTVMLEPLLNFALLTALLLVRRPSTRSTTLAGVALGLACAIKLWPAVFVLVLTAWLHQTRDARRAVLFVSGAAGGFAVVVVPFLGLAGWDLIDQVLLAQAGRDREASLLLRLRYFDGLPAESASQRHIPDVAILVLTAAFLLLAGSLARRNTELRLWLLLLLAGGLALAAAPVFYYHYAAFVGVPIAGFVGIAFAFLWDQASRPLARTAVLAAGSVTIGVLAVATHTNTFEQQVAGAEGRTSDGRCLWASGPAVLLTLDRFSEQIPCGFALDPFAVEFFRDGEGAVRADLARADGAILAGGTRDQDWSSETVAFFHAQFRHEADLPGYLTLWRRTAPRLSARNYQPPTRGRGRARR
jgi:alpha-1,2-mannosyltransferase